LLKKNGFDTLKRRALIPNLKYVPKREAEVVVDLVGLVNAWLRSVGAETQGKQSG